MSQNSEALKAQPPCQISSSAAVESTADGDSAVVESCGWDPGLSGRTGLAEDPHPGISGRTDESPD